MTDDIKRLDGVCVLFKEKHGDVYVTGSTTEEVFAKVLQERISDTYGLTDTTSVWYEEDTQSAIDALNSGQAEQFMRSRIDYEYEGYYVVNIMQS